MARGPVLLRRKQSFSVLYKTEWKRCIMPDSLWNKYDISRKSPEVPVKRSPKMVRKEKA